LTSRAAGFSANLAFRAIQDQDSDAKVGQVYQHLPQTTFSVTDLLSRRFFRERYFERRLFQKKALKQQSALNQQSSFNQKARFKKKPV
jgi:hypothetical protein